MMAPVAQPMAMMAPQPRVVTVTVPPGHAPGTTIQVMAPNGQVGSVDSTIWIRFWCQ